MRSIVRALVIGSLVSAVGAVAIAQERVRDSSTTMPTVVKSVKAEYTRQAMDAGIQGTVVLEAVVLTSGTVGDVKVTKSLDREYGLDDQAVKAVKQWEFKPGTKDGKPVPVAVAIEVTFTLK